MKTQRDIRKWAREIDFFFTGEKTEVLFTDLRAIEKKELCQKWAAFYSWIDLEKPNVKGRIESLQLLADLLRFIIWRSDFDSLTCTHASKYIAEPSHSLSAFFIYLYIIIFFFFLHFLPNVIYDCHQRSLLFVHTLTFLSNSLPKAKLHLHINPFNYQMNGVHLKRRPISMKISTI